jgi:CDP-glycerol glycerophosphotransferase (TagB/SpsB family)
LLNKPIVFFPYDLKDYLKKDVGLYLNYQNVTPGIKTYTVKGLARSIKRYILNPDYLKKERSLINEQFNKFSDDFNSKRVYDEIKKL